MNGDSKAPGPGSQIDTQIASLQADVQALKADTAKLKTDLTALTARVTALEEGSETPPDPVDPPDPEPTGDIPLSWDDPRFNQSITRGTTTMSKGQNYSNKSWEESSGNPTVTCNGNNVLDTCRIKSREAVRIGGSGTFDYQNCYFEAQGQGADHADTIQAYSPGSRGTLVMRNTCVRAYNQAATAGLFIADNWTGTVDLQDVVFWGGPFGLRVHPDTGGDNILKLRNVFFVGPFGYAPYNLEDVQGHRNIIELWENVCEATIQNGVLVPGSPLARP